MDYKRLANLLRQFDDIALLAHEIQECEDVETIDELSDYLEYELELSCQ